MADSEAIKILGGLWAESGDRTDPDDTSVTPTLTRTTGWPSEYSTVGGETPKRARVNQRFRELDGAASDSMRYGILPYDALVDYRQYAHCTVALVEYTATVANGPATTVVDPTTSGQTTWDTVTGEVGVPDAPSQPTAVASNGQLVWSWNCPKDNGAAITHFLFEWRETGGSYATVSPNPTIPYYVLTGLTNGTAIDARVTAVNAQGSSQPSSAGQGTPVASVPSGGDLLALRAESGNASASLTWLEPDNGGASITSYTIQWAGPGQNFQSSRQQTSTNLTSTVSSLTNTSLYRFRVAATNSQGTGTWSNTAQTTPQAVTPTTAIPDVADRPTGTAGQGRILWFVNPPSDNGADITSYDFRFRRVGTGTWTNRVLTAPVRTETGLTNGSQYEAQIRAENSVGTQTTYSSSGNATPAAEVPDQVQFVGLINTGTGVDADWGAPENNGGTITGYRIEWDDNSGFSSPASATTTNTERTITGLSEGTTYYFRVRATNGAGNGSYSPTNNLSRDDLVNVPGSPPNMPSGEHVVPVSIRWEWEVPRDNGALITSFELQWRISGSGWSGNIITGLDASCYTHTGRTLNTTYEIRVRGRNSAGVGGWGGTGSFELPATEGGIVSPAPSAPAAAEANNELQWTWTPPTGFTILDHEFQTRLDGASWSNMATIGISSAGFNYASASPGESYDARARVRLSGGASNWSATGSVSNIFQSSRAYVINDTAPDHVEIYDLAGNRITGDEFNLTSGQSYTGISVSGSRIYALNNVDPDSVEVYNLSGNRQTSEEFNLATLKNHTGISVSGSRIYVVNIFLINDVEVYNLAGTRQNSEEFNLVTPGGYEGISVSGSRVYVVSTAIPDRVEVYNLAGTRQNSEEFNLVSGGNYAGISVAGSRVYAVNTLNPDHVEVWDLSGTRQTSDEFNLASNANYSGISVVLR